MVYTVLGFRSTMFLIHMTIWIFAGRSIAQTCIPSTETNSKSISVYLDQRLDGYEISLLLGFKLQRCAEECLMVSPCKSFNYGVAKGVCELNSADLDDAGVSSLMNVTDFVYHDIRDWPVETVGTCASRPCANNQRCIATTPFTCVDIDCGQPPVYTKRSPLFTVTTRAQHNGSTLGSKAVLTCLDNRFKVSFQPPIPHWNKTVLTCNSDSSWSHQQLKCKSIINDCKDVKECNPNYGDGHYWIHNRGELDKPFKAYCHNMATSPKIYITLPHHAISAYYTDDANGGLVWKHFSKVRILNHDLRIGINDDTFATHEGLQVDLPFASAGSCGAMHNGEKYYGHFSVNTRGTKLRLKKQINWDKPAGSEMVNYSIDANGMVGYCWGSSCGLCKPSRLEFMYYHEGEVPNDNLALEKLIDITRGWDLNKVTLLFK